MDGCVCVRLTLTGGLCRCLACLVALTVLYLGIVLWCGVYASQSSTSEIVVRGGKITPRSEIDNVWGRGGC